MDKTEFANRNRSDEELVFECLLDAKKEIDQARQLIGLYPEFDLRQRLLDIREELDAALAAMESIRHFQKTAPK